MEIKGKQGFTLIELMIAVAVIGILAAAAVPKLTAAADQAKAARIQSDLGTIGAAVEMYYARNGAYPSGLESLVSEDDGEGYLRTVPHAPSPAEYTMTSSGEVTCTFNGRTYSSFGSAPSEI